MSSQNYFKTWQLIGDEMTEGERERRPSTSLTTTTTASKVQQQGQQQQRQQKQQRYLRPQTFGCDHDIAMTGFENDKDAMNAKEWKEMEHLPGP